MREPGREETSRVVVVGKVGASRVRQRYRSGLRSTKVARIKAAP